MWGVRVARTLVAVRVLFRNLCLSRVPSTNVAVSSIYMAHSALCSLVPWEGCSSGEE